MSRPSRISSPSRLLRVLLRLLLRTATTLVAVSSLPALAQGQAPAQAQSQSQAQAQAQAAPKRVKTKDKTAPAIIRAEQVSGRQDREIVFENDVELVRDQTKVTADKSIYHPIEDEVEAYGNVRLWNFGDYYTGDSLKLNLDSGKGDIINPTYKFELNNAQGAASRIDFLSETQARVTNGTYSTCEGFTPDWYLQVDTLDLDTGRNIGSAGKTVVYFKGVPILGTPALSFPLTSARQSGLLPPTIGATSTGGAELTLPYYFNIAPNRDLTLFPKLIARRGLQLGANGRYLGKSYSGETTLEVLLRDRKTETNRYALSSTHRQWLTPALSYGWNLNHVSDDDYPSDFADSLANSTRRQLLRELRTDYAARYWNASLRVQNYQILQDPASILDPSLRVERPYDRLPQLSFHGGRHDVGGFDWAFDSELTRFWHPDRVRGVRLVVNPQVSYPLIHQAYFVTPKLSLNAAKYQLDGPALGSGPNALNRVLPTFSVDSGVVFERDSHLLGRQVTQTLEPRLFYVNTPYRDQSQIPLFDTADTSFNFSQLFSENRFTGQDRISDANQVTAALVSRYIEPSGAERLRLAFGQRFYFRGQRVVLDNTTSAGNESRSDLLLSASGRLTPAWAIDSAVQYNAASNKTVSSNYGVQWKPAPKQVLNVEYRYLGGSFEQLNISGQRPLAPRLYGVGRISYSLPERRTTESLLGIEYNADCWVLRMVVQRFATAARDATTSFFLQLELNGLSKLGPNPLEALSKSIPGYQRVNQPEGAIR
jgi:LPS-assembly protein